VEVWLFTFVGASRGHLCNSTAFLFHTPPAFLSRIPVHRISRSGSASARRIVKTPTYLSCYVLISSFVVLCDHSPTVTDRRTSCS